jgi:hypothetical protein
MYFAVVHLFCRCTIGFAVVLFFCSCANFLYDSYIQFCSFAIFSQLYIWFCSCTNLILQLYNLLSDLKHTASCITLLANKRSWLPHLNYQQWWQESKEAAGILRSPISLHFIVCPTSLSSGVYGEQHQSHPNQRRGR